MKAATTSDIFVQLRLRNSGFIPLRPWLDSFNTEKIFRGEFEPMAAILRCQLQFCDRPTHRLVIGVRWLQFVHK